MMRAILVGLVLLSGSAASAETCKPKLADKVTLTFQPEQTVADLATWITSMTCMEVNFAKDVPKDALRVTILAPNRYTAKQALRLVLDAIEATGVKLTVRGNLVEIRLGPDLPKDCVAAAPDDGIKKLDDTHYEVSGALLDKLAGDFTGARLVPAMRNGKPEGLKLYAIRPTSVFHYLGFENGDTVTTIDKVALGDTKLSNEDLFKQVRKKTSVTVELIRASKPLTFVYTITK